MVQAIDSLNNLVREEMPQKQRKKSIGSRIVSAMLRTKATKRHLDYQKYYKGAIAKKRSPMSFRVWSETKGTYFGGPGKGLGRAMLKGKKPK